MAKTMLINMAEAEECRIAIVDNGNLEEVYLERDFENQHVGNIYLGKVINVEPSMQAAFIDFGAERNGFLHVSDVCFDAILTDSQMEKLGLKKQVRIAPSKEKVKESNEDVVGVDEEEDVPKKKTRRTRRRRSSKKTPTEPVATEESNKAEDEPQVKKKVTKKKLVRKKIVRKKTAKKTTGEKTTDEKVADKAAPPLKKKTVRKKTVKKKSATTVKRRRAVKKTEKSERRELRRPVEERRRRGGRGGRGGGRGESTESPRKGVAIQDVLKKGQMIVVQVSREAIDHKGAQLTSFLSLAGRTLVLMPHQTRIGISRKIHDGQERSKLKDILKNLDVAQNMGCIVRTSGVGKTEAEFKRDLKVLGARLDKIRDVATKKKTPTLLFEEANLAIRALRDVYTDDIKSIIIDSEDGEKKVRGWLRSMIPGAAKKLHLHTDSRPLFNKFGVEDDFEGLFMPQVQLSGGATLVIEQTEAFVSIDVNTARMKDKDQNTAIYNANKAAAREIPRQLRLRDLGGLIMCDFIDMTVSEHRRDIEKRFNGELKKDRARVKCSKISQFGVIEVSRQRMRQSVERATSEDCPTCQGYGKIKTPESVGLRLLREIRLGVGRNEVASIQATAQMGVVEFLQNEKRGKILDLEKNFDKIIRLHGDPHKSRDEFEVRLLDADGRPIKKDKSRSRA